MLKIRNLCKKFSSETVLNDINLSLAKSEVVGLAGASGGGKSTLLRCVCGLETPTSGTVEYAGKIGFMFQDFQLFPHMNVLQNLIYAPSKTGFKEIREYEKEAEDILGKLNIASKATAYPCKLSGGQKQRVALARSLMTHPDLLLCDEPTSGLDQVSTNDIINLLKGVKDSGIAMIIASHNLEFLSHVADRIIVIEQGKIIEK